MVRELVEALLQGLQDSSVTEIEYEADGQRLRITRSLRGVALADIVHSAATTANAEPQASPASSSQSLFVVAPMHGTFYRALAPGEAPIVEIGQMVAAGQQVAVLEAMKMLHAVEAESDGRVMRVLVENGADVELGIHLFELEPVEGSGV